jgi:hypothetical protein
VAAQVSGFIVATLLVVPVGAAFLVWLADGTQRGRFDHAKILSTRYILSVLLLVALCMPFFLVAGSRKPGATLTWGEAMVAATYVFLVLFWLYGVVPHEYLNWADSELSWRPDKILIGPGGSWASWWSGWERFPMAIHKQILRDLVAVIIYAVGLGGFVWACAFWNKREETAAAADAVEPVSTYGRPLVAKAKG